MEPDTLTSQHVVMIDAVQFVSETRQRLTLRDIPSGSQPNGVVHSPGGQVYSREVDKPEPPYVPGEKMTLQLHRGDLTATAE